MFISSCREDVTNSLVPACSCSSMNDTIIRTIIFMWCFFHVFLDMYLVNVRSNYRLNLVQGEFVKMCKNYNQYYDMTQFSHFKIRIEGTVCLHQCIICVGLQRMTVMSSSQNLSSLQSQTPLFRNFRLQLLSKNWWYWQICFFFILNWVFYHSYAT